VATKVVDAVMEILGELRPENVELDSVIVTGEGERVEIILVPHRDLGGVALIVWRDESSTHLSWAQVHDLSTHDDLDQGVVVALVPHEGDWLPRLRDALAAEIRRPIRLRWRRGLLGRKRIECIVAVDRKDRRVGVLRPTALQPVSGSEMPDLVTSLASGPPLPFSIPLPLENWRRWR
jgi:hypothetical protein